MILTIQRGDSASRFVYLRSQEKIKESSSKKTEIFDFSKELNNDGMKYEKSY